MSIQYFLFNSLDYAKNFYIFLKLGYFEKGLGTLNFVKISFYFLIGLCPIWVVCVCVGQLWHFNMYLGKIQSCSCIAHMLIL